MAEVRGDQAIKARLVVSGNAVFEKGISSPYLEMNDQKEKGNAGGTFTGGNIYYTRDLTKVVYNDFAVTINLASSAFGAWTGSGADFTLPAGVYYTEISCPAMSVNEHMARLADVTDNAGQAGSDVIVGTSEFAADAALWKTTTPDEFMAIAAASQTRSIISGRFELSSQRTLEIQHRCSNTQTTDGFGSDANFYDTRNIFTTVKMWQIRDGTTY